MPTIEKPYPSWILNEETNQWVAPIELPDTENMYSWDEENRRWTHTGYKVNGPFN